MQISKLMPAICAVTVCAGLISARAQDNPAQAAARAALMEKMSGPDASLAPTNAETPPIIVTPSGAALEPQNPPAAIVTPPPAPTEPQPAPTVPATPPASAVAPIQTPEPAATMSPPPDNSNPVAPASSDNAAQAARAALEQKMSEAQEPPPVETPAPAATMPAATEPAPSPAPSAVLAMMPATNVVAVQPPSEPAKPAGAQPGNETGLKPIVAPPLPISMTKEEQLQALLNKYKSDQITPQEYFKQRAAILAGP
jgi:hypothetical protein